jgi:hypothetical protein
MPCEEHSGHRLLALGEAAFEPPPLRGDGAGLGAHRARLRRQLAQPPVRSRDGALRVAQRVARLAPRFFLALELPAQGLDAAA